MAQPEGRLRTYPRVDHGFQLVPASNPEDNNHRATIGHSKILANQ
jgi:hypothetical protein